MNDHVLCQVKEDLAVERIRAWVKGLASEVDWWDVVLYKVKYCGDLRKERLKSREFIYQFNENIQFDENDTVVDIGSGPLPVYGNIINGKEITYLPLDPLAFEYRKLYQKYDLLPPVLPNFAIMEGLSSYLSQKVDYVICTNAMDHSIDPIRALLECVKVLKIGGVLLLAHLESEAEYANYDGLHQWNITLRNKELLFYNREQEVNVSSLLNDFCKIELMSVPEDGGRHWNVATIIKVREIADSIKLAFSASFYTGMMTLCLMDELANKNDLYLPCEERFIPDHQNFIIFGMGNGGIRVLSCFGEKKRQIRYFIDNSVSCDSSDMWQGFQVKNPSLLEKSANDMVLIASKTFADEMKKQLESMGFLHGKDFLQFDEFKRALVTSFG